MTEKQTFKQSLSNPLSKLNFWQAIILIGMLTIAAFYGANVTISASLEGRVSTLENQINIPVNSTLAALQKQSDYIISMVDTYATLQNGTTGALNYMSTNWTKVEQFANGNLTANGGGLIWLKNLAWNSSLAMANNVFVVEMNQGILKYYSNQGAFLIPQLLVDPSTVGWTQTQQGYFWYNSADDTMKYWNGSATVIVPSIGGGSINGTYSLPYTYTIFKAGSNIYSEKYDGSILSNSTTAITVFQATINAIQTLGSGAVYIRDGTYDFGSSWLNITFPDSGYGGHIAIIGEGSQGAVEILGTGQYVIRCINTDWGHPSVKPRRLQLMNLDVRHNTFNNDSITFELLNCYPRGEDVALHNTNGTRQGIAWHFGGTNYGGDSSLGAYGEGNTLTDSSALYYGIGFFFDTAINGGPDHFLIEKPYTYGCLYAGFYLNHTWLTTLVSPEVIVDYPSNNTVYPWLFKNVQWGCSIVSPICESWQKLAHPYFTSTGSLTVRMPITDFTCIAGTTTLLYDTASNYVFTSCYNGSAWVSSALSAP